MSEMICKVESYKGEFRVWPGKDFPPSLPWILKKSSLDLNSEFNTGILIIWYANFCPLFIFISVNYLSVRECILYLNVYYYMLVCKRAILSVRLKNLKTMHHSSKSHLFPQFLRSPFYLPSLSPIASFFYSFHSVDSPAAREWSKLGSNYLPGWDRVRTYQVRLFRSS